MEKTHFNCDTTKNHVGNVSRELFKDEYDPKEDNLNGIVPLQILTFNKQVNHPHSDEILSQDKDGFESDESAYDSDCSLGSMNSLYLVLNDSYKLSNLHETNSANEKCVLHEIEDTSKIVKISESKTISSPRISEKRRLKDKNDKKPAKKITTIRFYGNQESISRRNKSRLFIARQQKKKKRNTKIFKARYLDNNVRKNFRKSRSLLKNRKYGSPKPRLLVTEKKFKNDKICHLLKKPVPLLKLNRKIVKKMSQNNNLSTHIVRNGLKHIEEDFHYIPDYHSVVIEQENNLSECNKIEYNFFESNTFPPFENFIDVDDDFGGIKEIDDIIKRLFEDDLSTEN